MGSTALYSQPSHQWAAPAKVPGLAGALCNHSILSCRHSLATWFLCISHTHLVLEMGIRCSNDRWASHMFAEIIINWTEEEGDY